VKPAVYRARWILPISSPPIEGGWLAINDHRVIDLGHAHQSPPSEPIDLGDVAILPGLVNAHTHLEFSYLEAPIGQPGIKLYDWIGEVIRSRQLVGQSQTAALAFSADAIRLGLQQCYDSGTVLVGDIATTPFMIVEPLSEPVPEVVSMAEVLGLNSIRAQQKIIAANEHRERLSGNRNFCAGISPHAPYSTPLQVVERCVDIANKHDLTVAMHVAECNEERRLIENGDGPFADKLKELNVFSAGVFPWGPDATMNLLNTLSKAPRSLVVHGNDVNEREIDLIAKLSKRRQMSVVYCPRTHAYFGYENHPVLKLIAAGARVALGTDSLASNPDLSLWGEVQWLIEHRQDIEWQAVLAMATLAGADAFGRQDLGRIETGSSARLLVLPTNAANVDELGASILRHRPRWLTA